MPLRAFEETADLGRGALNNELNQPGHLPTASEFRICRIAPEHG
jgi:hypothetical protein